MKVRLAGTVGELYTTYWSSCLCSIPHLSYRGTFEKKRLEFIHLLGAVTQLLQRPRELALVRRRLLRAADGLVHARRAAHEELDVARSRFGQDGLEQVLVDVTPAADPLGRRPVEHVEGPEPLRVPVLELVQLVLQQHVVLRHVPEHERHLGAVLRVVEDGPAELVHRRDPGAAGDQRNVLVLVGRPRVLGDRALEVEPLVWAHAVQVLGHGSVWVPLDHKVEVAFGAWEQSVGGGGGGGPVRSTARDGTHSRR